MFLLFLTIPGNPKTYLVFRKIVSSIIFFFFFFLLCWNSEICLLSWESIITMTGDAGKKKKKLHLLMGLVMHLPGRKLEEYAAIAISDEAL